VIDGMVDKPGTYSFDEIVAGQTIEERIYRLRCVEAGRW
jgi:sulfoxide reductase catalytic subunit YedY